MSFRQVEFKQVKYETPFEDLCEEVERIGTDAKLMVDMPTRSPYIPPRKSKMKIFINKLTNNGVKQNDND